MSQTAVPFRPGLGRRVSSQSSRSYQQPRVINQRAPIPFKSELFSPLKTRKDSDPFSNSPMTTSPTELTAPTLNPSAEESARSRASSVVSVQQSELPSHVRTSSRLSQQSSSSNPAPTRAGAEYPDSAIDVTSRPASLALKTTISESSTRPLRPVSLTERTRQSMAFRPSGCVGDDATSTADLSPSTSDRTPPPEAADGPLPSAPEHALLARTRQSISLVPASASSAAPPGPGRGPRPSFPVNPFATPQKPSSLAVPTDRESGGEGESQDGYTADTPMRHVGGGGGVARRDITPREKLFDEDAEYASVFKARPRIALSPVASPRVAEEEGEGKVVDEMEGGGSPLAGR